MEVNTYDYIKANEEQIKYCNEHGYPHFAPTKSCYRCHQNIYEPKENYNEWTGKYVSGYSVEYASNNLITGCPHCHYSFCE